MTAQEGHATPEQYYEVITPTGKVHKPPKDDAGEFQKLPMKTCLQKAAFILGKLEIASLTS